MEAADRGGRSLRLSASQFLTRTDQTTGCRPEGGLPALLLPCLNSNNCNGRASPRAFDVTQYHLRTAFALGMNATAFVEHYGIERCGFLTLTFAEHVVDIREGQRRLHSLVTGVIAKRYEGWICVPERMVSGRLHYHLFVACSKDIRSGSNFAEFERCCYVSANQALRDEWAFWRATAPRYGFGRTELLPIKSNAEGVGRYLGKYIGKHVRQRDRADKGARMVRYGGNFPRRSSSHFQFNSPGAREWRTNLAAWCLHNGIRDWNDLQKKCGNRWGYFFRDQIRGFAA